MFRAADAVEGKVHAVAVNGFLDVLHQFPDFHGVHEERGETAEVGLNGDIEKVRRHALDLFRHGAHVLGPFGDFDAQGVLHNHGVGERMAVGAEGADAFREGLIHDQVALLSEVFHAAVDMAALQNSFRNRLAVNGEMEVHRLFEGHMYGTERKLERAACRIWEIHD